MSDQRLAVALATPILEDDALTYGDFPLSDTFVILRCPVCGDVQSDHGALPDCAYNHPPVSVERITVAVSP